jgi:diguanylate cyclase (GGDEF)-like protein
MHDLAASGRHFAGTMTRLLVEHVQDRLGDDGVGALREAAGDERPFAELVDDTAWSTYHQLRSLLEAASRLLADVGGLEGVAETARIIGGTTPELAATVQSFGSPMAMSLAVGAGGLFPVLSITPEQEGPTRLRWHRRMVEGFEPFPELCAFLDGVVPLAVRVFGLRTVAVTATACQCRGDDECMTVVEWDEREDMQSRLDLTLMQLQVAQSRLESFQQLVNDIVSTDDLDSVLARIVQNAARATNAPGFVLTVDASPNGRRLYTDGIDVATAESLLADEQAALTVEVASAHRRYGRLTAFSPTSSIAFSANSLESYARLAATALDSAFSLEEARRQARTTAALLELSTSLAELNSVGELATKLADATPDVIDCDAAAVVMITDGIARVAAHHGFATGDHEALERFEMAMDAHVSPGIAQYTRADAPPFAREIMELADLEMIAAGPIVLDDGPAGYLVAAVRHEPERMTGDVLLAHRFAGLTGQAAVALRNSRLLDQIRHQSLHDALTGLPNRALILDRAQHLLARAHRHHVPTAALFIDLDGFKEVNDTLGHLVGDQLLSAVADRLKTAVRTSDTVGRLGGDEFVVLAEGASLDAGVEVVAERLLDVLREPFRLPGRDRPLQVEASIGIALGERHNAVELLKDADIALYSAKGAGKGCYRIFAQEMQAVIEARSELAEGMVQAVTNGEFFLVYQPIFALDAEVPTGVEALIRWEHPQRGVVEPDQFIPLLEETGLIVEVGRWVLSEACRQTAQWHAAGIAIDVSVNASVRQLECPGFVDDVQSALTQSGLSPASLTIEITETALMHDATSTLDVLTSLKQLGIRIAIDVFGTGYSSLSYLRQFPVDALKIDRSFIDAARTSPAAAELVHVLVQLGTALHIETLAEGIEYHTQLEHLQTEGCDSGQGFLFARPLEADKVPVYLAEYRVLQSTLAPAGSEKEPASSRPSA